MKQIIDKLFTEVQNHPAVLNSTLSVTTNWKRTHYFTLSEIISENLSKSEFMQSHKRNELGVTISSITLYRIFTNDYSKSENSDLRFLKSLDKIAIFLGYPNLNAFLNKETIVPSKPDINKNDLFLSFQQLIKNSCEDEFKQLKKLPAIDLEDYPKYTFHESPLKKRLIENLYLNSKLDYRINIKSEKSNYELFDFKIIKIDQNEAVISVKEFWNLDWVDNKGNIISVFNNLNRQTYFIKKIDDQWKIWDNYNPNYSEFITHLNENIKKATNINKY
ncbi:MAG: hypothetical protein V4548_08345 [Bacteroidota bacterium]